MASLTTVRLYKTDLKPEHNARYESLEEYLSGCDSMILTDFQYVKPALQTYIKVPMAGNLRLKPFNYCRINTGAAEDKTYYYFITRIRWVSDNTLGMTLVMDTVNTFWDELEFTKNTHVTRMLKDRFQLQGEILVPIIDPYAEDISVPQLVRTDAVTISDGDPDICWYLIQKTDYSQSDSSLSQNPVTTYVMSDEKYACPEQVPITIYPENISGSTDAYAFPLTSRKSVITAALASGDKETYEISTDSKYDYGYYWYDDGVIVMRLHRYYESETSELNLNLRLTSITLNSVGSVYRQPSSFEKKGDSAYYVNPHIELGNEVAYNSYEGGDVIYPFNEWYRNNKTDGTLVKITCLPYQPVDFDSLELGVDYEATANGLRLLNPNVEFRHSITDVMEALPTYPKTVAARVNKAYSLKYETKQYNSAYHQVHYAFDNNVISYSLESFYPKSLRESVIEMGIEFVYNTEMSSSFMFRFTIPSTLTYEYTTDFGECMVCDKSLDVPYYTNEYLNYMRYGKAVDEKNLVYTSLSSGLSGVSTGISSTASVLAASKMAALGAAGPLGFVTASIGAISSVIGVVSTISKARDAINLKIDNYRHQASSVSGTSDISVFREYSHNKLMRIIYDMPAYINDSVLNYFRLYGYATDKRMVPDLTKRYWSDFCAMEPEFKANMVDSDYMDDIISRCKAGLRVYHWHGGYDLDCELENWETSLQ